MTYGGKWHVALGLMIQALVDTIPSSIAVKVASSEAKKILTANAIRDSKKK